jgi:hypothetical protein
VNFSLAAMPMAAAPKKAAARKVEVLECLDRVINESRWFDGRAREEPLNCGDDGKGRNVPA